jgi:hypothetical protein
MIGCVLDFDATGNRLVLGEWVCCVCVYSAGVDGRCDVWISLVDNSVSQGRFKCPLEPVQASFPTNSTRPTQQSLIIINSSRHGAVMIAKVDFVSAFRLCETSNVHGATDRRAMCAQKQWTD